jgi:hypothetical protein
MRQVAAGSASLVTPPRSDQCDDIFRAKNL